MHLVPTRNDGRRKYRLTEETAGICVLFWNLCSLTLDDGFASYFLHHSGDKTQMCFMSCSFAYLNSAPPSCLCQIVFLLSCSLFVCLQYLTCLCVCDFGFFQSAYWCFFFVFHFVSFVSGLKNLFSGLCVPAPVLPVTLVSLQCWTITETMLTKLHLHHWLITRCAAFPNIENTHLTEDNTKTTY